MFLWHAKKRQLVAKVNVGAPSHSVAFSPNGAHLAVGTVTGAIKVLLVENLTVKVVEQRYTKEAIDVLHYSPDGTKLAAGSHDNFIDIFDATKPSYPRLARCAGHSSYIRSLDWSVDSRLIQSSCGAYELLYFDAATGKQVRPGIRLPLLPWFGAAAGPARCISVYLPVPRSQPCCLSMRNCVEHCKHCNPAPAAELIAAGSSDGCAS